MGCDICFYKHTPEVKAKEDESNLLYITQKYENTVPTPIGVEYIDFDKYFEGKEYKILWTCGGTTEVEVDGKEITINDNDLPTYTKMEEAITVEEIGYYRISYDGVLRMEEDNLSIGFGKKDNDLISIFESTIGLKTDVTPKFFRNKILPLLKSKGFKSVAKDLKRKLKELPETQVIVISY